MESNVISLAILVIISIYGIVRLFVAIAEHEHVTSNNYYYD